MIKAVLNGTNNRQMILLGISDANVERLKAGDPIVIDGTEIGINHDISIVYGATEGAIIQDLRKAGLKIPPVRLSDDDA